MKRSYLKLPALLLALSFQIATTFAQAPQGMTYQAIVRNGSNTLITSTTVGVRISVLQGSVTGTAVYEETQTPATNANGLVTITIGSGVVVSGTFAGINWANGPYFIKTETDPAGGTNYTITGTSQLMSVPYALYAETSGGKSWQITGDSGLIAGTNFLGNKDSVDLVYKTNNIERMRVAANGGNVGIGTATPGGQLDVEGSGNVLLNSGNVGIGTTNPQATLHVNGSASIGNFYSNSGANLNVESNGSTPYISQIANGFSTSSWGQNNLNGPVFGWDVGDFSFNYGITWNQFPSAGTTAMTIKQGGNVGIGTAAPIATLDVVNGANDVLRINSTAGNQSNIAFCTFTGPGIGARLTAIDDLNYGNHLGFETSNPGAPFINTTTERMRITDVGNVGIGTTSPTTLLQVGNGGARGKLSINSQDQYGGQLQIGNPISGSEVGIGFFSGASAFGDAPTSLNGNTYLWNIGAGVWGLSGNNFAIGNAGFGGPIITLTSAGNVGVGSKSPISTLQVQGSFGTIVSSKSVNYTATATDNIILATAAGITISLPNAATAAGRHYTVKLTAVGSATVNGGGSNIDGSATYNLSAANKYVTVASDGTNWWVIANN